MFESVSPLGGGGDCWLNACFFAKSESVSDWWLCACSFAETGGRARDLVTVTRKGGGTSHEPISTPFAESERSRRISESSVAVGLGEVDSVDLSPPFHLVCKGR
jgi:hypothetical protein